MGILPMSTGVCVSLVAVALNDMDIVDDMDTMDDMDSMWGMAWLHG